MMTIAKLPHWRGIFASGDRRRWAEEVPRQRVLASVQILQMIPARNYRHARESGRPGGVGTAVAALDPRFRGGDGKRGAGNHLLGSCHYERVWRRLGHTAT